MTASAKTTTNNEIKSAIDALCHRFDMFEQKEETRHELLERDTKELKVDMYGNGKEGMKTTMKTLKDDYDQRKKNEESLKSSNQSLRNGIYLMLIGQAATIIISLLVR